MFSIHSFSFEKGSNRQNHSSSGSLHPVKKSTPSKIPPPLSPPPYCYLENPAWLWLQAVLCFTY